MGFDCTLHVVDEATFPRFCAHVLDNAPAPAFAAAMTDAAGILREVEDAIALDPAKGARLLGQLALLFVSTETPHAYCRGFALTLWDDAKLGAPPPRAMFGTVEDHLEPILARHPTLRRKVPRAFDGNYCTGGFIPAAKVPAMLAYVEQALAALVPGDRRTYGAVVTVLRAAAERGLAYWEGTDIGVAQAHEDWLAAPVPTAVEVEPVAPFRHARLLDRELVVQRGVLHDVTFAMWPPSSVAQREWKTSTAARAPWGALLASTRDGWREEPAGAWHGRINTASAAPPGALVAVGDAVLAIGDGKAPIVAMFADGTTEALALPPRVAEDRQKPRYNVGTSVAAFADGRALISWDGKPYRWDGRGHAAAALPGELGEAYESMTAIALLPDGSLAGCFGRKLVAIAPDGTQRVLAPIDNAMHVGLGPEETLVVAEGDNPEGDFVKLLWLGSHELAHVPPALLGIDTSKLGNTFGRLGIHFDHATRQLVFASGDEWIRVAWTLLEALPRTSLDAYATERAALVKRWKP